MVAVKVFYVFLFDLILLGCLFRQLRNSADTDNVEMLILRDEKHIYNPKSEKVGTVWKTQIKKESSDF